MGHKNAIKHENIGPPLVFFHNPKYPPSKEFENDSASMIEQNLEFGAVHKLEKTNILTQSQSAFFTYFK